MAIKVSQAFERTSANPIDETIALTKAKMLTVNDNLMPDYYFTICQDDGNIYLYDKSATPSATTGKFTKFEGGGGGHTILDTTGTAVAQEDKLQFVGLDVSDDSTNGKTKVQGEGLNSDSIDDIAGANTINPAVIIGDSNNYSTSEKIVGKWIDGKPLYQKTWTGLNVTPAYNSWTNVVDVSSINIDRIIAIKNLNRADGHLLFDGGGLEFFMNNGYITAEYSLDINRRAIYTITIQYTKTTD